MIQLPGAVLFVIYFIIGPFGFRQADTLVLFGFMVAAIVIAIGSQRSSHQQSIALLFVLSILCYESLQSIASWLNIERDGFSLIGGREALRFVPFLFTMNVGLAVVGVVASITVALSLEVRKTRLPLAKLFPDEKFVSAPRKLISQVSQISRTVGVAPPYVSLIDSGNPAAFITRSRRGFELAISVGLVESLTETELEACIAHELSHVKNNDFAVRSLATSARVALFAHPLSHFIEPAIYRAREFLADKTAVQLTGRSDSLISALTKIRESQDYVTSQLGSVATACLFDSTGTNGFVRLLDKHPSLESRIKALRELNFNE